MSKAERYIELVSDENGCLCDQHALKAVEIAREEIVEKVCSFIADNISEYIELKHATPTTFMEIDGDRFANDLKQAMKDETQNI